MTGLPTFVDADALEDIVLAEDFYAVVLCSLCVEQRGKGLHIDRDVSNSVEGSVARWSGNQRDGLFDVAGDAVRERRLILGHEVDHVLRRDVCGRHEGDVGPVEAGILIKADDAAVSDRAPDGCSVQAISRSNIVYVLCIAPYFRGAICTRNIDADGIHA